MKPAPRLWLQVRAAAVARKPPATLTPSLGSGWPPRAVGAAGALAAVPARWARNAARQGRG